MLFQSMPFATNFSGTTDIATNFTCFTRKRGREDIPEGDDREDTAVLLNSFRGRALYGREVPLPAGYQIVLAALEKKASSSTTIESSRRMHIEKMNRVNSTTEDMSAATFISWRHDREPPIETSIQQWINLSQVIHGTHARTRGKTTE